LGNERRNGVAKRLLAKKVYVRANQFVDGWESLPTTFWAIVPAWA
jgi:hypothetical protein